MFRAVKIFVKLGQKISGIKLATSLAGAGAGFCPKLFYNSRFMLLIKWFVFSFPSNSVMSTRDSNEGPSEGS